MYRAQDHWQPDRRPETQYVLEVTADSDTSRYLHEHFDHETSIEKPFSEWRSEQFGIIGQQKYVGDEVVRVHFRAGDLAAEAGAVLDELAEKELAYGCYAIGERDNPDAYIAAAPEDWAALPGSR